LHRGGKDFREETFNSFVETMEGSSPGLDLGGLKGDKLKAVQELECFRELHLGNHFEESIQGEQLLERHDERARLDSRVLQRIQANIHVAGELGCAGAIERAGGQLFAKLPVH